MSGNHGDHHGSSGQRTNDQEHRRREDQRSTSERGSNDPMWGRNRPPSEHHRPPSAEHRGREIDTRAPGESMRDELRGLVNATRYQERPPSQPADTDTARNPPPGRGRTEHGHSRHETRLDESGAHAHRALDSSADRHRPADEHQADGKAERRDKPEQHNKSEPERHHDIGQKLDQLAVNTPVHSPDAAVRSADATRTTPDQRADAAIAGRTTDAAAAPRAADWPPESRVSQLADTVYRSMLPQDGATSGDRILAGLASGLVKTVAEAPLEMVDMTRLAYHAVTDPTDFQPEREQWASDLATAMAGASTRADGFEQARQDALTSALVGATPIVGEVAMVSHLVSAIQDGDDRKIGEALAPVAFAAAMHAAGRGAGEAGAAERPPRTMLEHAYHHGVRDQIPEGNIEVFAHGAPERFVNAAVDTGGGNLSATGGNHGGRLHTLPSLDHIGTFAARAAGRGNDNPGVLGIALPEGVARSMREQGQLVRSPVGNPPDGVTSSAQQWVFMSSGIERLKQEGFFFRIR